MVEELKLKVILDESSTANTFECNSMLLNLNIVSSFVCFLFIRIDKSETDFKMSEERLFLSVSFNSPQTLSGASII